MCRRRLPHCDYAESPRPIHQRPSAAGAIAADQHRVLATRHRLHNTTDRLGRARNRPEDTHGATPDHDAIPRHRAGLAAQMGWHS